MPMHDRPFSSLKALDETELEYFKLMTQSRVAVAVPAALHYCAKHELDAPRWLAVAAMELLCDLMRREKSNRRGRSCGHIARHRQDMIDFERWSAVFEVREKQKGIRKQVDEIRAIPTAPRSMLKEREKMLAWVGSSLNRAFECAAMLLEGSEAYASPEAIKRSYFQVERNSRDPKQALRYHLLDPQFEHKIGIKHQIAARPGKKIMPLHELTI